jgi:hypothetical protein
MAKHGKKKMVEKKKEKCHVACQVTRWHSSIAVAMVLIKPNAAKGPMRTA